MIKSLFSLLLILTIGYAKAQVKSVYSDNTIDRMFSSMKTNFDSLLIKQQRAFDTLFVRQQRFFVGQITVLQNQQRTDIASINEKWPKEILFDTSHFKISEGLKVDTAKLKQLLIIK